MPKQENSVINLPSRPVFCLPRLIHLCCNLIVQTIWIVPDFIQIHMRPAIEERHLRVCVERIQGSLQQPRRAVQIERVGGADDDVNFPGQIRTKFGQLAVRMRAMSYFCCK